MFELVIENVVVAKYR